MDQLFEDEDNEGLTALYARPRYLIVSTGLTEEIFQDKFKGNMDRVPVYMLSDGTYKHLREFEEILCALVGEKLEVVDDEDEGDTSSAAAQ